MRKKLFILVVLLILSSSFAIQTYADFAKYSAKRQANTSITSPPDSLIAFDCGRSLEVMAGSSTGAVATVVTNRLTGPIDMNVQFHAWVSTPPDTSLEVQPGSDRFSLFPRETKNVWVTVTAGNNAVEGVYNAILKMDAVWDGGSAEILTNPCPLLITVKAPRQTIEKVLTSGPAETPLYTRTEWTMQIRIDTGIGIDGAVVTDVIPGEFELVSYESSRGTVSVTPKGKSTHIKWSVGTSGSATLDLTVATRLNPSGKYEFTTPGTYELNDGACIKDTSLCTSSISVNAQASKDDKEKK